MSFEKKVPVWNASGTEPPDSLKNKGFEAGQKPPADYFNWFWHSASEALSELQEFAFQRVGVYSDDMNELVTPGQYRLQSNTNLPNDAYYGQAFVGRGVVNGGNNDTVSQMVIGYQGKAALYYRGGQLKEGGWTWTEWSSVYSDQKNPKFNSVAWLGLNPVTTPGDDTVTWWTAKGSGFAQYSALNQLNDQPSRYGFLVNYTYGSDVFQIWYTLPSGAVYSRSGNASGWYKSWTKIYDELNPPTPNELGVASLSGGTYISDSSDLNDYKTVGNYHCSGDANAATLSNCPTTHAFRMYVGYATGNTSYVYQELIDWVTGTRYYRQALASGNRWSNWDKSYDTTNLKFSTIAFVGSNPVTTATDDTPEKWRGIGSGYAWYSAGGQLIDQPSQYGFLINYCNGSDIFQVWKMQNTGAMYIRSGNNSGWGHTWAKVYDSLNKPTHAELGTTPIANGGTGATTAAQAKANLGISLLDAYPVGSLYMSGNSTSPASLFGGSWERIQDKFLVGAGGSFAPYTSGGKTAYDLTAAIGAVNGNKYSLAYVSGAPSVYQTTMLNTAKDQILEITGDTTDVTSWSHGVPVTEHNSASRTTNIVPPYQAVFIWYRVA